MRSIVAVHQVLSEFESLYGLKSNPDKSTYFCVGVPSMVKSQIVDYLGMKEGKLYLGVPLISSRLCAVDCDILLEKITGRINSWLSHHLSFDGRLQLISSVPYSLQVYWSSIFILPKKIIRAIEQKFNRFLWNCTDEGIASAKVAWNMLCLPKKEGGVGIKKFEEWNRAAIMCEIRVRSTRSDMLVEIQSKLCLVPVSGQDTPQWTISKSSKFFCSDTWNAFHIKHNQLEW
jgi:hypothetical protein